MEGVDSLETLRNRVRIRGQKVGGTKCVWADGFAMETIANHFQLLLLVVDERSSQKFTRIAPRCPSGAVIDSDSIPPTQATVLLHASQREHMNLICYDGRRLTPVGQLPLKLQGFWGLRVIEDGAAANGAAAAAPAKEPKEFKEPKESGKGKGGKAAAAAADNASALSLFFFFFFFLLAVGL